MHNWSHVVVCQVPIDVFKGITDEDAAKVVDGLATTVADRKASIAQMNKLYNLFYEFDCTLAHIFPDFCLGFNHLIGVFWFL